MDNVNHPAHYEVNGVESFDIYQKVFGVDSAKEACIFNAFKYIWRHKRKNGVEDVEKARWYLDKYIELSDEQRSENDSEQDD